ncbi:hypothetical protein GCM10009836_41220 [Pseudonocardia ailaonensis]|uniref:dUTPase n=3 Tax=Pseudonocardia TaxID=1847 RepID=A0ABN2N8G5_9PSEU
MRETAAGARKGRVLSRKRVRPASRAMAGTKALGRDVVQRHEVLTRMSTRVGTMATDYDAPRRNEADDMAEDSLDELKARRNEAQSSVVDVDESDTAESFELPGADLSGEELTVKVLPKQADEFTCGSCFLVHHRSRLAETRGNLFICRDCAA